MIVNAFDDGYEIMYQRSHALLAAMFVAAWRRTEDVPRITEVIIATAQHDDQEMFWDDTKHLSQLGAPLDFTKVDLETSKLHAQYTIQNAYRQGLWVALLISKHNSFLYERRRGEDTKLDAFLDEQAAKQQVWREELGYSEDAVNHAYALLCFADQLSILCKRELPGNGRELDVMPGPDGVMIRISQREDETIRLDPWVFEDDEVRFSLETRKVRQLQFKDEAEFKEHLDAAKIELREWVFRRDE